MTVVVEAGDGLQHSTLAASDAPTRHANLSRTASRTVSAARDGAPYSPAKAAVATRMRVKNFHVSLLSKLAMPNGTRR